MNHTPPINYKNYYYSNDNALLNRDFCASDLILLIKHPWLHATKEKKRKETKPKTVVEPIIYQQERDKKEFGNKFIRASPCRC